MSYIKTGYLEYSELESLQTLPDEKRYQEGPVAVIECVQNIPCNPCEASCKFGAIHIGSPITNLPTIDTRKCIGCGNCIAKCPGMAIFVVNKTKGRGIASVSFPYEYYPVPKVGDKCHAVDRKGEYICDGTVSKVVNPASYDHTPVVTIDIPIEYANEVRSIERGYQP
ncbi:MAG: 4Fe-4S ferredoxin [Lachnospiraceae bacterium]|uniref:4Fe-4S ferredoxin n=1 Tax=Candidatus Weimeria bifida TaxID=2599074 RepID=A0A6N7IXE0_9FIRM|nr:4Fe-4S ferredoxin [Candidatus Weimeria bifida]RRF94874.1 MAG: 4Fe-4S ferredoxin [Lachnospiraceae bacterium]